MNPISSENVPNEERIGNHDHQNQQYDHSIETVVRRICSDPETDRKKNCDCEPRHLMTRAGPFFLGTELPELQQNSEIRHFIARRFDEPDTDNYYLLKIICLPVDWRQETRGQSNSKMQIYNEYSVLSLLKDVPGVIQERGLYMDYVYEKSAYLYPSSDNQGGKCHICPGLVINCWKVLCHALLSPKDILNQKRKDLYGMDVDHHFLDCEYLLKHGKFIRRLILALDCHVPHCYLPYRPIVSKLDSKQKCPRFQFEFENLQEYVKRSKYVPEMKALKIFAGIVDIMYGVHAKNVAHRDLRLENILYNDHEEKIIITNFGLSRYVINDKTCICDHRGSSAYISPDVLKRVPYQPIASDCWSLGVIFYTMLYGRFPFNADNLSELFRKIRNGTFRSPTSSNSLLWNPRAESSDGLGRLELYNIKLSQESIDIVQSLIETDVGQRNNIAELRERLDKVIKAKIHGASVAGMEHLPKVPDIDDKKPIVKSRTKHHNDDVDEAETNFDQQKPQDYSMKKANNVAFANDHVYARKVPEISRYDACNSDFYRYAKRSKHCKILKVSTYIPSLQRFYNDSPTSVYNFPGRTSLLYEQLRRQENQNNSISTNGCNSNNQERDSAGGSGPTEMNNNNLMNMTVVKVESDIRPLEDHEYCLVEQKLRFSSHNNNSNI